MLWLLDAVLEQSMYLEQVLHVCMLCSGLGFFVWLLALGGLSSLGGSVYFNSDFECMLPIQLVPTMMS